MRIVDLKTFLKQPGGTVFAKYEPCCFEEMLIKGESLKRDFCYQQIVDAIDAKDSGEFAYKLDCSQETGESIPMNFYCQGRDGCFKDDQLFAIFEKTDLEQLINRLQLALECYE